MKQNKERPLQASRRASSWPLKGMFSNVEGHLLASNWAFPLKERRMISEISWQFLKTQSAFFFSQKCILFLKKCILFSQRVRYFSHRFTLKNRLHCISQRPYGRQISQSITANISWNVLWILYAGGLLWVRYVRKKALLTLWVLWEKKLLSKSRNCSFSHRKTQKNRTHKASQRH